MQRHPTGAPYDKMSENVRRGEGGYASGSQIIFLFSSYFRLTFPYSKKMLAILPPPRGFHLQNFPSRFSCANYFTTRILTDVPLKRKIFRRTFPRYHQLFSSIPRGRLKAAGYCVARKLQQSALNVFSRFNTDYVCVYIEK